MLVKTSTNVTNYVLPVIIELGENKRIKRNRYYDNEYILFKAYRQLKAIKGRITPLYPVVNDNEVRI